MTRIVSDSGSLESQNLTDAKSASAPALPFETALAKNLRWALSEGSNFFEGRGAVQLALRKIARRLNELNIPYAVAGGMALFANGFRRFTEDVNVLVTGEGLRTIHGELAGRGYVELFAGSRGLRDTEHGVRVEFLVSGQFPGDGKPKPVAFPDPTSVSVVLDGIRYLNLHCLIELKLASGMTSPDRIKDLADVQELIKTLHLPAHLADCAEPLVAGKYAELWNAVATARSGEMRQESP